MYVFSVSVVVTSFDKTSGGTTFLVSLHRGMSFGVTHLQLIKNFLPEYCIVLGHRNSLCSAIIVTPFVRNGIRRGCAVFFRCS